MPLTLSPELSRQRVADLRRVMQQHEVTAVMIPTSDPHLSEYLPERWQGRVWVSGFTGSSATFIVTQDFAGLWTDNRYWAMAERELAGSGIELMKVQSSAQPTHEQWLCETLKSGDVLSVDGAVMGVDSVLRLQSSLQRIGVRLRTDLDLLQPVWTDRPALPDAPVYEHEMPFAGRSRAEKLAVLRERMQQAGAQWHWISTLDDIAWLFNLRGADVAHNPVFVAHALVSHEGATLFVQPGKLDEALLIKLQQDAVSVAPYDTAPDTLAALPAGSTLLLDPRRISHGMRQRVASSIKVIEQINPTVFAKSQKNEAEAANIRQAMEQDGAALCEFFAWFEQAQGKQRITELTIDEHLTAARARRPHYKGTSFSTIAGFNANGASPHYRATASAHAVIEGDGLLLIDSGGQYLNGTTDITRVVPVGRVSAEQKEDYTLVLKATMALSMAKFPKGIRGPMLDAIARAPLWATGRNFAHGTGHGVGYFLNVHEGPQGISCNMAAEAHTAMEIGMVTSIEPAFYRPGQWGIRIENLAMAVPAETNAFGTFLKFETLTLCPIDTRCIVLDLLRDDERAWLNQYHAEVRRRLGPLLQGEALAWLERNTQPI